MIKKYKKSFISISRIEEEREKDSAAMIAAGLGYNPPRIYEQNRVYIESTDITEPLADNNNSIKIKRSKLDAYTLEPLTIGRRITLYDDQICVTGTITNINTTDVVIRLRITSGCTLDYMQSRLDLLSITVEI